MPLKLLVGESSVTGPRERNEDFSGIATPAGAQLQTKGALVAVADGVSGNAGGREAAEMAVRTILSDYYATPDTWEVHAALDKVITAANRWMLAQAAQHKDFAGMATTLSLLVLRGQRYYSAHVGDTRIYRLRGWQLQQLTTDHVWDRPDMRHVLKRAVGLDQHLAVDYAEGHLEVGDVFALMTDGIWDVVGEQAIHQAMGLYDSPQMVCDHLSKLAMSLGGQDNATILVVRVAALGEETLTDLLAEGKFLKPPERMRAGDVLDGFEVLEVLHESRSSLLYKVRNPNNGQLWVMKTLQPLLAEDKDSCQALLNEEWLAKRVVSQYLPQVLPLTGDQRSRLYYVMSWHEGATLQQRLEHGYHFTASGIARIAVEMLRGLGALHRLKIIHRDIKPANLHMAKDNRLRLLDLGVALSSVSGNITDMKNPGTPSFMAPELFEDPAANERTDIYAVGVTLYHLMTRKYPYGEIEPFQRPRFGNPVPPTRYRPDIPQWLENIILKAVARNASDRFETAEEMLLAFELGETKPILPPPRTPLIARARLVKWQWIAIFSLMLNMLLLYLLLVS